MSGAWATLDGNEAAARVANALSEVVGTRICSRFKIARKLTPVVMPLQESLCGGR